MGPVVAEQDREIDLLLTLLAEGEVDLLLRAQRLLLDARELPLVDHARVANAIDVDGLLQRGRDLAREIDARPRRCGLDVLDLHLRDDDALGVGATELRGVERALGDVLAEPALAGDRALDEALIGERREHAPAARAVPGEAVDAPRRPGRERRVRRLACDANLGLGAAFTADDARRMS